MIPRPFPFPARESALCDTQSEVLKREAANHPTRCVLDLGCSDLRRYSEHWVSASEFYVGMDMDHAALTRAKLKPASGSALFVTGTAERIPFPNDFFDVVVLNDMLAYCDQPKVLREVRRVLSPSGLAISLHNNSVGWSIYKLYRPEKPALIEWGHTALVILNTIQLNFTGRRLFRTQVNSERRLRSAISASGLTLIRFWSSQGAYRWFHFVARKDPSTAS